MMVLWQLLDHHDNNKKKDIVELLVNTPGSIHCAIKCEPSFLFKCIARDLNLSEHFFSTRKQKS